MIQENDLVYLHHDQKNQYLLKAERRKFNTSQGCLNLGDLIGKNFGDTISTHTEKQFSILKPSVEDIVMRRVHRATQIIYPKDAALILVKSGIRSGDKILEVGTGSGALTIFLANFIGPTGKVYTYERNQEFFVNARRNIEEAGFCSTVVMHQKEIKDSFEEQDADFVMIDLPTPWEILDAAFQSLKNGHRIASILPTVNQVERFVIALEEKKFLNIETIEVWLRHMIVRPGKTRPEQLMPSHTGYLIFATKKS